MRFILPAALLAAVSLASVSVAQTAAPDFTADAFRSHVVFLSDDLLEGRETGSRGHEIAARYVATQFEGLGLKPGNGDSWYQQVPFGRYTLQDGATVTIDGQAYRAGEDVLLFPSPQDLTLDVQAPVVFVGYGLDSPGQGFNDYAGLDVKGKVVAFFGGVPKGTPSDVGAHLGNQKAIMAAKRGAIGTITLMSKADEARRPWETTKAFGGHPSLVWKGVNGAPYSASPGIRFATTLGPKASESLFVGAKKSFAALREEADRQNAKPRGFALKQSIKVNQKTDEVNFTSPNVLAVIPGSDPSLANEYVLLMAHLDHIGADPKKEGDQIFNGAMDNATGISTLIEVAKAMTSTPTRPKRPILLAAVTAEESGLLGAQYLAKHPVVGDGKVVSVVNLDMPILTYDFQDVIAFGAEHSTMGPIVERAGASMGVKLIDDPLPQERLFVRSDHYRFVQEGIPSVFLMTGFGNGGSEKFQHYLRTDYHKVSDEIDLPFNWDAGAKFAKLNYMIAREIADAPQAPRWYEGNFFGNTFAPGQPKAARAK